MKRILVLKDYRSWSCKNAWIKLAIDEICKKNNIEPDSKYGYTYEEIKFRMCDEIIDLLEQQEALGEFRICEIPDDYTDICIKEYDDYEYLFYVKDGKMYDENNELLNTKR